MPAASITRIGAVTTSPVAAPEGRIAFNEAFVVATGENTTAPGSTRSGSSVATVLAVVHLR